MGRDIKLTPALAVAVAGALILAGAGLLAGQDPAEGWQLAARWTARWSLALFLLLFLAERVERWTEPQGRLPRRALGLAFAVAHALHAGTFTAFFVVSGETPSLTTVVGGGMAYGLIAAMAVGAVARASPAAHPGWQRLQSFTMAYVWLIFLLTFAKRLSLPGRELDGAVGVALLLLAGLLRWAPALAQLARESRAS